MRSLPFVAFALALAACAPTVPLDKHNADMELANAQILGANATAKAIGATSTALAPRLQTAEVDASYAATFFSELQDRDARISSLIATVTALAPTPTPPCPSGQVKTAEGACAQPTPTLAPTPTQSAAQQPKRAGLYLVGSEIAPGYWRGMNPHSSGCYWEIDTASGDIADNHFGTCASIMFVPDWAMSVEIGDGVYNYCGASASTCPVVQ
jgi:hypothetical protein